MLFRRAGAGDNDNDNSASAPDSNHSPQPHYGYGNSSNDNRATSDAPPPMFGFAPGFGAPPPDPNAPVTGQPVYGGTTTTFGGGSSYPPPPGAPPPPPGAFGDNSSPNRGPARWCDHGESPSQQQQQQQGFALEVERLAAIAADTDVAVAESSAPPNPYGDGKAREEFRVVMKSHWLHFFVFFAAFILLVIGIFGTFGVGATVNSDNIVVEEGIYADPAKYILLGIGGGLCFITGLVFQPYLIFVTKTRASRHLFIKKFTLGLPPLCMGVTGWETEHDVDEMDFSIHHWITTSTDKNGRQTTHHHSCLTIDDVGIMSTDEDDEDVEELARCLGRGPGRGHGEPDNNLCLWWSDCGCGCY